MLKVLYIITLQLVVLVTAESQQNDTIELPKEDLAIIYEAYHLQKNLGNKVWPQFSKHKAAVLFKSDKYDFLINHRKPPSDFSLLKNEDFMGNTVHYKITSDSGKHFAMYRINDIPTVIVSKPDSQENKCEWVLKTVHEMFHTFQEQMISYSLSNVQNFRASDYAQKNELNFPYPYFEKDLLSIQKLEADRIFRLITKDSIKDDEIKIEQRRFADIYIINKELSRDSLQFKFKHHMEWKEGVARYVEQNIAILASDKNIYSPTVSFSRFFPNEDYSNLTERYQYNSVISPIRFIGEGVIGGIMFYYSGMGKAYLLDRIFPQWKQHYFNMTLDEMVIGEKQFLTCTQY